MPSEHSLNTLSACTLAPPFFYLFFYFLLFYLFFIFYFLPLSHVSSFRFSFLYINVPPPPPLPLCLLLPSFWCSEVSLKPRPQVGGDAPVFTTTVASATTSTMQYSVLEVRGFS